MKVHALAHFSMPFRNAGSETVLAELMKAAVQAGHEATIWCTHQDSLRTWKGTEPVIEYEGVTIRRVRNALLGARAMRNQHPHVVVTHHQHATQAIKAAKLVRARSVFLTHNDMDLNDRPLRTRPDLVIHNSEWVRESLSRFGEQRNEFVFHPPLTPERHIVEATGDAITLINLNEHKGSELFYKLAEIMPERRFLGVVGGHGQQVVRRHLPNVTIMEHGPDMKRVWASTRVLLMPSIYESYGLTAVEAGINGIPTIANPTPGLLENLGDGGLFADRDAPTEWLHQLERLDEAPTFVRASHHARRVAEQAMDATRRNLTRWVEWLQLN